MTTPRRVLPRAAGASAKAISSNPNIQFDSAALRHMPSPGRRRAAGAIGARYPMDERAEEIVAFLRSVVEEARDLAPDYALLKEIANARGYDEQQRYWLSLLYVGYGQLPSALSAMRLMGHRLPPGGSQGVARVAEALDQLPCSVERRICSGHMAEYFMSLLDAIGEVDAPRRLWNVLSLGIKTSDRFLAERNFARFVRRWRRYPGQADRRMPYQTARVLRYVHDWPIRARSLMLTNKIDRQPAVAILDLYPYSPIPLPRRPVLYRLAADFQAQLFRARIELYDWEMIELALIRAANYVRGRTYVGYEHDRMLSVMARQAHLLHPDDQADILRARAKLFAPEWLGEVGGWAGIRIERVSCYRLRVLRPLGER